MTRKRPTKAAAKLAPPKKPSGAQNRRRRAERERVERERELQRAGLNAELEELLAAIGRPSVDPIANSAWANRLAAALAHVVSRDKSLPLGERCKRTAEMLDRVTASHSKAIVAQRIERATGAAGVGVERPDPDRPDVVQVAAGAALRARDPRRAGAGLEPKSGDKS